MIYYFKTLVYLLLAAQVSFAQAGSYEDFFSAIRRDDAATVQALVQRGFDPNTPNETGVSALHWALQSESFKAATALAQAPGLAADKDNEHGETPLMMAALKGQKAIVVTLLARGARVNKTGWTPLHYAASGADAEVVSLLIARQADLEARSPNGTTALMMAAGYGPEASVDLLLAAKAQASTKNELGLSAADFARRAGREALSIRLQAAGASVTPPR